MGMRKETEDKLDKAWTGWKQKSEIKENPLKILYRKSGVWALLAKPQGDKGGWQCLQVGKNKNIGKEIYEDIGFWQGKELEKSTGKEKIYINWFGEEVFRYYDGECARKRSYLHMRENYNSFIFVAIEVDDETKKSKLEKALAVGLQAEYWRNGRPFKKALPKNKESVVDKEYSKYVNDINEIIEKLNMYREGSNDKECLKYEKYILL